MVRERRKDEIHRLAVLRSDRELAEVGLRVVMPEHGSEARRYVVERAPVGDRALRAAWARLAAADWDEPSVLADILWVLVSTVPVASRPPAPPVIKPTASRT